MTATSPLSGNTVLPRPEPYENDLDAPYWEGLKAHQLLAQKCNGCGKVQWGPEHICHRCHSFDLTWTQIDGEGTIYSWERVWHPVPAELADHCPYVIVLVELPGADGIRMLGNLVGDQEDEIVIGSSVRIAYDDRDGYTLANWERV